MWIAVSTNILTACSLCIFTCLLVIFLNSASKDSYIPRTLFTLARLFALFFTLCGMTHALIAIREFYPKLVLIRDIQIVLLLMCATVSLVTVCVSCKSLPTILGETLPKVESSSEENGKHADHYMLETVDVVKDSIVVLSGDLKVVRENTASKELFGSSSLIGKPILQFIHPADIRRFETFAQTVLTTYTATPMKIEYRIKPAARIYKAPANAPSTKSRKSAKVHSEEAVEASSTHLSSSFSMQSSTSSLAAESGTMKPEFVHVESILFKHMYLDKNDVLQNTLEMVTRVVDGRKKQQRSSKAGTLPQESEEQGRINSAKLRYLSCIAHDLKTPLQSFSYTLDLLLQTSLLPDQRSFINQATVAVDLMKLTISQTMDISKALTGAKLMPRRTTVLLSTVLSRVEIIIAGFGKQVPVNFEIAPTIIDEIITDEEWLWQMLLNLLTNACKYTDKGSITVRVSLTQRQPSAPSYTSEKSYSRSFTTRNLAAHDSAAAQLLLIEVIDTGVGVSSDKLPTMFDAFAQVQDGQVTGTGLGLYGVRMRVEGLQGTCGARHNTESSTGTGTVMWFAIPYLANRSRTSSEVASIKSNKSTSAIREAALVDVISPDELALHAQEILQRRPLTAMVVEDTLTVRKLMERMLLQIGFATVVGYENGSKGLDAMMAGTVDIVFSDVQMPVMTGPEMATRFRKFEAEALASGARSKRQVIVAVTANGTELRDNANVGFDDVYAKPLGRSDIHKIINQFL